MIFNILQSICVALFRRVHKTQALKKFSWLLLAVFFAPIAQAQSFSDKDWAEAAENVVRLRPDQFPFLSKSTVAKLEQLRCRIPQHAFSGEPNNLIPGQFLKRGQTDVALLCERDQMIALLVLPDMGKGKPMHLAVSTIEKYLQGMGENKIGFSWEITKIPMRKVMKTWGGSTCKWRPHDAPHGINHAFIDKWFIVRYSVKARWQECEGSD